MVGVATLSTAIPTAAERAATSLKRCRAVVRIRAGSVVPARGRMIAWILILAALTCRVMSDASTPRDAASLALKAMLSKSSKVPAIVMSSEILVSKLPPGGSGGMLGGCGESGGGKDGGVEGGGGQGGGGEGGGGEGGGDWRLPRLL